MKRIGAIFMFYKAWFLWSFLATILVLIFSPNIASVILTKLCLILFLWFISVETKNKRKLLFYNKMGISTWRLFSTVYVFDIVFTIPMVLLIREFI